jgi:hypothetical protein
VSAPLVINLRDGSVWQRRAVSPEGVALYALAGSCQCPEFLMATEAELAALGIAGSADVLPMPVGQEPRTLDRVEDELTGVSLSLYEEELESARLRLALQSAQRGRRELRADCQSAEESRLRWRTACIEAERERDGLRSQVAALLAERHSTNEALDDAAKALRAQRDRIAELEQLVAAATEFRVWEPGYGLYVRRSPGATGFAILEARRTSQGRRAWTTSGWSYSAVLAGEELFCWPDARSAVAEARRVLPGAVVREDGADRSVDRLTALLAPSQALREPDVSVVEVDTVVRLDITPAGSGELS